MEYLQPFIIQEDEEVYLVKEEAEEEAEEEAGEELEEFLYSCSRFEPYPTPSLLLAAALLAGAI